MAKKTPYDKLKILHENHWKGEKFKQRMTTRCWKLLLLNDDDKITFNGPALAILVIFAASPSLQLLLFLPNA